MSKELIPLPFECPDLIMPLTGRIKSTEGFEYTSLLEIEKKLLLGLKLSLSLSSEIGMIGTEQWIVWLAISKQEFILHMWNPVSGELKQIQMKNTTFLPSFDEKGEMTDLRISSGDNSLIINGNGCNFMKELSEVLESAAQGLSSTTSKWI
jgi:hypothetical protein